MYMYFNDKVVLKENIQLDEKDPDSVKFNNALELVKVGKMTKEARATSISKCSMFRMVFRNCEERGLMITEYLFISVITKKKINLVL